MIDISDEEAPSGNARQQRKGDFVIEVRPTIPEVAVQKPMVEEKKEEVESMDAVDQAETEDSIQTDEKIREQPMSRAERRRRIKEEIRELSQGETPMYYQRRLW